jgi:hypothetical protein
MTLTKSALYKFKMQIQTQGPLKLKESKTKKLVIGLKCSNNTFNEAISNIGF